VELVVLPVHQLQQLVVQVQPVVR